MFFPEAPRAEYCGYYHSQRDCEPCSIRYFVERRGHVEALQRGKCEPKREHNVPLDPPDDQCNQGNQCCCDDRIEDDADAICIS
jgi:hypothetical protein